MGVPPLPTEDKPVTVIPSEAFNLLMPNEKGFFDYLRKGLMAPTLSADEVEGVQTILRAMVGCPIAYVAYALATAWHETAHTMQPIKEYGGNAYFFRMYDIKGGRPTLARQNGNLYEGDGIKFPGRGYVQLTWRSNYARANTKLHQLGVLKTGESLVDNPDLAMRHDVAAAILRWGMSEGWFTSKRFSHYLPAVGVADKTAFRKARAIINGVDRAALIADYAIGFQEALIEGEWKVAA